MAYQGAAYSPKQLQLAFKAESTIGTGIVSSMQRIDVDSVEMPGLNPLQVFDMRQGDGRVLQTADAYIDEDLQLKEISFSGTADSTSLPLLLQNITNSAQRAASGGSVPAAYVVPDSFQPSTILNGASGSSIINTCTVAILSPSSGADIYFPGCRLTSLQISGDMGTENGRVKVSGSFSTAFTAVTGQDISSPAAWGTTKYYMHSFSNAQVAGVSDCMMQSFSINIENPVQYLGFVTESSKREPQAIAMAIPELSCSIDATMKYDDNTDNLDAIFAAGTAVTNQLANHGTWHTATSFGFYSKKSYITSLGFSEAGAQMVDVSLKCAADASGSAPDDSLFEIIA